MERRNAPLFKGTRMKAIASCNNLPLALRTWAFSTVESNTKHTPDCQISFYDIYLKGMTALEIIGLNIPGVMICHTRQNRFIANHKHTHPRTC